MGSGHKLVLTGAPADKPPLFFFYCPGVRLDEDQWKAIGCAGNYFSFKPADWDATRPPCQHRYSALFQQSSAGLFYHLLETSLAKLIFSQGRSAAATHRHAPGREKRRVIFFNSRKQALGRKCFASSYRPRWAGLGCRPVADHVKCNKQRRVTSAGARPCLHSSTDMPSIYGRQDMSGPPSPDPRQAEARQTCAACRNQKRKCDRGLPKCGLCTRTGRACDYSVVARPAAGSLETLQQRLTKLEDCLSPRTRPDDAPSAASQSQSAGSMLDVAPSSSGPQAVGQVGAARVPLLLFLDVDRFRDSRLRLSPPTVRIPAVRTYMYLEHGFSLPFGLHSKRSPPFRTSLLSSALGMPLLIRRPRTLTPSTPGCPSSRINVCTSAFPSATAGLTSPCCSLP